jgi:ADP-heptose:LPS heptosyltransferase
VALFDTIYGWQYQGRQWLTGQIYRLRFAGPAAELSSPSRRILIVMTGLLGDTVMSTPVVVEARRLWPGSEITVLGNRQTCALYATCPMIDTCVETPAIPFTIRKRQGITDLERWLREQNFDVALILLGDQFAPVLARARIPVRVGVRGHLLEPCLTHSYDIGSPRTWGPRERLGALRVLGCDVRDVPPRLWVSDDARSSARRRLAELGLPEGTPYAAIHPFGSTPRQRWPVERVAGLAEDLRGRYGLASVLLGGPETRGKLPSALGRAKVIDSTGAFDIQGMMGVMAGAGLVVSTDSGPFHVAGALGRPLVGLFRAWRPEHAARYPQARVAFGEDPSCERRCRWDRCQALPCRQLLSITPGQVLECVEGAIC